MEFYKVSRKDAELQVKRHEVEIRFIETVFKFLMTEENCLTTEPRPVVLPIKDIGGHFKKNEIGVYFQYGLFDYNVNNPLEGLSLLTESYDDLNCIWLDHLIIKEAHRGKGFGTLLLRLIQECADYYNLAIVGYAENENLLDWYYRNDFEDFYVYQRHINERGEIAIVYYPPQYSRNKKALLYNTFNKYPAPLYKFSDVLFKDI